jgi:hypothetical protein
LIILWEQHNPSYSPKWGGMPFQRSHLPWA